MEDNRLCRECGSRLSQDEIGISKKLINRGTTEFYCVSCLSAMYHVDTELIYEKIEYFRSQNCTLFNKTTES